LGHGPFFPAYFSLTVKRAMQPGQVTWIGIGFSKDMMQNRCGGRGQTGDIDFAMVQKRTPIIVRRAS
jgi:hypothetical protein